MSITATIRAPETMTFLVPERESQVMAINFMADLTVASTSALTGLESERAKKSARGAPNVGCDNNSPFFAFLLPPGPTSGTPTLGSGPRDPRTSLQVLERLRRSQVSGTTCRSIFWQQEIVSQFSWTVIASVIFLAPPLAPYDAKSGAIKGHQQRKKGLNPDPGDWHLFKIKVIGKKFFFRPLFREIAQIFIALEIDFSYLLASECTFLSQLLGIKFSLFIPFSIIQRYVCKKSQ